MMGAQFSRPKETPCRAPAQGAPAQDHCAPARHGSPPLGAAAHRWGRHNRHGRRQRQQRRPAADDPEVHQVPEGKANGRDPSKNDAESEWSRPATEEDLKHRKDNVAELQLKELEGAMHRSEATMTDLVWHQVNARGSARASDRGCHQCGRRYGDVLRARTAPAGGRMSDSTRCFRKPCQTAGEQEKAPGISGGPPRLYRRGCA